MIHYHKQSIYSIHEVLKFINVTIHQRHNFAQLWEEKQKNFETVRDAKAGVNREELVGSHWDFLFS